MNRIRCGMWFGAGLLALIVASQGQAYAGFAVPEVDGGMMTTGLGLLTAGILLLRARRVSK